VYTEGCELGNVGVVGLTSGEVCAGEGATDFFGVTVGESAVVAALPENILCSDQDRHKSGDDKYCTTD
jgi:class 3 adenylate cyclase